MVSERKVISPLRRLLSTCRTDELFAFLHELDLNWALSRHEKGHYHMVIYKDGLPRYKAGHPTSPSGAIADALAKFLVDYQGDYHLLSGDGLPELESSD